ncbi:uncharacterized protein LOC142169558 [Nicotiana tabacum]|uniref:Uncharacterized protein LOC142169558 n=1 Tax=Nicotiana tabacum TaxID=4097 RepID=A0AC58SRD3_TOBAC
MKSRLFLIIGAWVIVYSGSIPHTSSIHAELKTLLQGLKLAVQRNLKPIHINVDVAEILTTLKNDNAVYTNIASDCRKLLHQLHDAKVTRTYREQNFVADILAKGGSKMECSAEPTIFNVPPFFVTDQFRADLLGTAFSR